VRLTRPRIKRVRRREPRQDVAEFLQGDQTTPLTLTVVGHQIVRAADAKGLLLDTVELGTVVFVLPPKILHRLVTDLKSLDEAAPN
jgi:hypothetical protein